MRGLGAIFDPIYSVSNLCKGVETGSGALMTEIVEFIHPKNQYAVLSGPTFAAEVAGTNLQLLPLLVIIFS